MIVLYTVGGTIGGNDVWQFGFHAETDADLQASATLVAAAIPALAASLWSASVAWRSVRATEIDEASGQALDSADAPIGTVTASSNVPLPAAVAVCVTVRPVTGLQSGRFYLPAPPATNCDANGNMTSSFQGVVRDRLQTFFQTSLGSASSPVRLGVYSRKAHNFIGAQRIEVGSVYDTQRRRRNKLVEARLSGVVL